jgi:uncharacterized integral membrane protein
VLFTILSGSLLLLFAVFFHKKTQTIQPSVPEERGNILDHFESIYPDNYREPEVPVNIKRNRALVVGICIALLLFSIVLINVFQIEFNTFMRLFVFCFFPLSFLFVGLKYLGNSHPVDHVFDLY